MPKTGRRVARHATIPWTSGTGWGAASPIVTACAQQRTRLFEACTDAGVQLDDRVACVDGIARLGEQPQAGARIDVRVQALASGPEQHGRPPDQIRVHGRHEPRARRRQRSGGRCLRQACAVVDDPRVAALVLHNLAELLERSARGEHGAHTLVPRRAHRRRRRAATSARPAQRTDPPRRTVRARTAHRCTPRFRAHCPPHVRAARPWRSA